MDLRLAKCEVVVSLGNVQRRPAALERRDNGVMSEDMKKCTSGGYLLV
jgi:hypothetical protein